MKKCKGCGITLQNENEIEIGYIKDLNQEYCQRCFRLTHYGDIKPLFKEKINNDEILNNFNKYNKKIFVLIVDIFDALILDKDYLLKLFKNNRIILVINKIDLLPKNITDEKIDMILTNIISKLENINIIDCLLTSKNDINFKSFFFNIIKEYKENTFIFVGRVNAGKSTIINKLIGNCDLTTSFYPGTTIMNNEITVNDYLFVDTPGLKDDESFVNNVDINILKNITPLKTIKPKIYQLYEKQTYFVEGLLQLDIEPKRNCNVSFYINNDLQIHRGKTENAASYINNNFKNIETKLLPFYSYKHTVNNNTFICIKGLGFIKINGSCKININIFKSIKPYYSEVLL